MKFHFCNSEKNVQSLHEGFWILFYIDLHLYMYTLYTAVYVYCIYDVIVNLILLTFVSSSREHLSAQSLFETNAFNSESPVYEKYFPYVKKNKLSSTQLCGFIHFLRCLKVFKHWSQIERHCIRQQM